MHQTVQEGHHAGICTTKPGHNHGPYVARIRDNYGKEGVYGYI
jgi:hypothetical protein